MRKIFLAFVLGLFLMSFVSATSISLTNINSTLARVSIQNALNLYAYEINLDYAGSIINVSHAWFLVRSGTGEHGWDDDVRDDGLTNASANLVNGDSIYGWAYQSSDMPNVVSVYASRLDNTRSALNGSGILFNITHSGTISLRYALFLDNQGNEVYVYYNNNIITLISPEANTQSTGGVTRFIFQPASSSGITSCSLNYQGGTYLTTSNIQNNAQNVIEVVGINENHPLWNDDLQWYISCLTPSGTLTSETRHLDTRSDAGSTQHAGETGQGLNPKYIDIIYSSDWYIGQDYTIQVHAYNQDNQLYDPANITFKGDSGFELTSLNSSIASFHVSDMKEGLHDLKVIVQDERTIENSIEINVLSLQSASPEVKKAIPKIYTVIIIAGSLVFLALIVALIIFEVYRRRRKAG